MPITITFLGHAGFLLKGEKHSVAIDPFLNGNPVATMEPDEIECQAIALTHGHADHFGDTLTIAKANDATVYAVFEVCEYCGSHAVGRLEPMNVGGKVVTDFGFIALTPAFHSSSYHGRYMGMPTGVIVGIDGVTVYHCGDTCLFSDMKLLGEIYRPDVAIIPVGDRFTMGPELATKAAEFIRPKVAIPIHTKTWPMLTDDPARFRPEGVEVKEMEPGETWQYG